MYVIKKNCKRLVDDPIAMVVVFLPLLLVAMHPKNNHRWMKNAWLMIAREVFPGDLSDGSSLVATLVFCYVCCFLANAIFDVHVDLLSNGCSNKVIQT